MVDSSVVPGEIGSARNVPPEAVALCSVGLAFIYAFVESAMFDQWAAGNDVALLQLGLLFLALASGYLLAGRSTPLFRRLFVPSAFNDAGEGVKVARVVVVGAIATCSFSASLVNEVFAGEAQIVVVGAVCAVLCGLSCGIVLSCWNGRIANGFVAPSAVMSNAFALSFVFTLVALWLDYVASIVVIAAFPMLSVGCLVLGKTSGARERENMSGYPGLLAAEGHLVLFAYMLLLCFAAGVFFGVGGRIVVSIALLAAFVPTLVLRLRSGSHRSSIGQMGKIYLPICIILAFALLSPSEYMGMIVFGVAYVVATAQSVSNVMFLGDLAKRYSVDGVALVATGRMPAMLGIGAGLTLAGVWRQIALPEPFSLIAPCCLAAFLVFAYAMLPFNRGNPMREGVVLDLDQGIIPLIGDDSAGKDKFKDRCEAAAAEHGLSPRETEVLILLACGYNMPTIAEMLFVSVSTVKTHTYRVYQKFDVHSQQEIISLLGPQHFSSES